MKPFTDELRAEYGSRLQNVSERRKRAARHYEALNAIGLWRTDGRILDVGCGAGLLLAALGTDRQLRVGCDLQRELYLSVRPLVGNIEFIQASGLALPFRGGGFALVTCLAMIPELPDWQRAINDMARCVAPGGVLYLTMANAAVLLPFYRMRRALALLIHPSSVKYAENSGEILQYRPERGFGLPCLANWRYIHITPHLLHSQFSVLRFVPASLLGWVARCVAPSFGFAWQRPLDGKV